MTPTCKHCRFAQQPEQPKRAIRCRRYPPNLVLAFPASTIVGGTPQITSIWQHPAVAPDETCGEFKEQPNGTEALLRKYSQPEQS